MQPRAKGPSGPPEFGPETPLPFLRAELSSSEAGYDATGAAGIILHDPLRHRFFRLPESAARMLAVWELGKAGEVAREADVELDEIQDFISFLVMSRLTQSAAGGASALHGEYERGEKSLGEAALHNYLFFRVPLFNPTTFLDFALPFARLLASKPMLTLLGVIFVSGLYFALRQWDKFVSTFFDFFSLEGLALYSTTLVGLKIFHELGHGFMARHFKCKVPVMGVAFMVMAPMLYTETTDAWRLKSRRKRLLIDAAGVMVEMAIAAIALFLWAFLPDGPWRSVMYFISATAWIMSVAVNLSPFMRFDGYHMLADALGMFNLGPRVFALATWQVRQFLFATREEPPEQFSYGLRHGLIAFAFGTWIYRLSLYLGIAYTVYKMFPKAVGIPLGIVEIWFFTALPIWREMKEWKGMGFRELFSTRRSHVTLAVCAVLLLLSALPLNRSLSIPAVMLPAQEAWHFPPEPARIVSVYVKSGDHVGAGQVLAELSSPDIQHKWNLAKLKFALADVKLARIAADRRDLAAYAVLKQEQQAMLDELQGLRARIANLDVRSSLEGIVTDVTPGLDEGVWVGRENQLMHVTASQGAVVAGLVSERESGRLELGANASFIPENGIGAAVSAVLTEAGSPGGEGIEFNYLSSNHGGAIAVAPAAGGGRAIAVSGVLPVRFAVAGAAPAKAERGTLTARAEPTSLLAFAFGLLVSVFLRESGF
jgi:putative peptide zinc metalloprotease protein